MRIAQGSSFRHLGGKDGLFFEVYKRVVGSFAKYLDLPPRCGPRGFFEVLRDWLASTEGLVHEDWIPSGISLLGNYGTGLVLKREMNRFLIAEDPCGMVIFVRFVLERVKLRDELDIEMMVLISDYRRRFSGRAVGRELDPGLFLRQGGLAEKKEARIRFLAILQRAIGAPPPAIVLRHKSRTNRRR